MSEMQPGQILANRYQLKTILGNGAMGAVWRAEHLMLNTDVAIKVIEANVAQQQAARDRLLREARAAAKLKTPHVVQVLDCGLDGETPFIVMELLEGENLAVRLEREYRLSAESVAHIVTDVAKGLSKAHAAGIIHRDLKPDNIYLCATDEGEMAKILDFGVALLSSRSPTEQGYPGLVVGTPYYMSPEQALGDASVDYRADLWALAVMTYECLVGECPFDGETLEMVFLAICELEAPLPSERAEVPPGFDEWFKRGCARPVDERFQSAREAAEELRRLVLGSASANYASIAPGPVSTRPDEVEGDSDSADGLADSVAPVYVGDDLMPEQRLGLEAEAEEAPPPSTAHLALEEAGANELPQIADGEPTEQHNDGTPPAPTAPPAQKRSSIEKWSWTALPLVAVMALTAALWPHPRRAPNLVEPSKSAHQVSRQATQSESPAQRETRAPSLPEDANETPLVSGHEHDEHRLRQDAKSGVESTFSREPPTRPTKVPTHLGLNKTGTDDTDTSTQEVNPRGAESEETPVEKRKSGVPLQKAPPMQDTQSKAAPSQSAAPTSHPLVDLGI